MLDFESSSSTVFRLPPLTYLSLDLGNEVV
jgi:hypothetical protein